MLGLFRRASGMWCWVKLVEMWPIRVEAVVVVNVWWSGVDRPRQAFDNRKYFVGYQSFFMGRGVRLLLHVSLLFCLVIRCHRTGISSNWWVNCSS